jgi:hypothetical protein
VHHRGVVNVDSCTILGERRGCRGLVVVVGAVSCAGRRQGVFIGVTLRFRGGNERRRGPPRDVCFGNI